MQKSSEGKPTENVSIKAVARDANEIAIEPTSPGGSCDKNAEKVADIEKDMRAYGMTDFEACTRVSKEDLETFVPVEGERPSLFGTERVCMDPDPETQGQDIKDDHSKHSFVLNTD